jgi:hypothetical protein
VVGRAFFQFLSAEGQLYRLPGLAAELVRIKVGCDRALYEPPSLAAKHATQEFQLW